MCYLFDPYFRHTKNCDCHIFTSWHKRFAGYIPPPGKYFQSLVNKKENLKTILNDGASFYYYAYIRLNARKADLSKGRWNPTKKIGGYHALSRDNGA